MEQAIKNTDEKLATKTEQYDKAQDTIMKFCRENGLYIQKNYLGRGIMNLIAYSRDPLRHANNLTNTLDQVAKDTIFDGYVVMKSLIAKEKFAIEVDSFRMVIIKKIHPDLDKLLKTYITGNDKWLPPELEMVDLFQRLYNPYSENSMKEIAEHIDTNLEKITAVEGGGSDFLTANLKVFQQPGFILLGDHAWNALTEQKDPRTMGGVITFMSDYNARDTIARLENSTTETYNVRKYDLMLPSDPNLEKYAITHQNRTVAIFYNSPQYELVPYHKTKIGVNCATTPVLLRFMYIDLYVFRIIPMRQNLTESDFEAMSKKTRANIKSLIAHKDESIFFSGLWFGTLRNEVVENVKKMLSSNERYYPYYPRAYFNSKKEYRKI